MSYGEYLIEIGKQTMISESGTTETNESKLHLRRWDKKSLRNKISSIVTQMENLDRKLAGTKKTEEKVELLSLQFQELSKMLMLMVSMQIN